MAIMNPYTGSETYEQWLAIEQTMSPIVMPKSLLECKWVPNLAYIGKKYLDMLHITEGKMLQVGATSQSKTTGKFNMQPKIHPFYNNLKFYNLDLTDDHCDNTIVADITNCPQVPDQTYNFVYSQDTFEHIKEPWLAAKEMMRILKPGGLCYVYTNFAWRYHEVPVDYWRFTPQCLEFLFKGLTTLEANYDARNRRGPMQGKASSGANDQVPEDEKGQWLENWRVFYVGRKNS